MKSAKKIAVFFLLFLFFSCAPVYYAPKQAGPVVRVGILETKSPIAFTAAGNFFIRRQKGPALHFSRGGEWRISVKEDVPAAPVWNIVLLESAQEKKAEQFAEKYTGGPVKVVKVGERLPLALPVGDCRYRVLLDQHFDRYARAVETNDKLRHPGQIIEVPGHAGGRLLLESAAGELKELDPKVRLAGSLLTVKNVSHGRGFHHAHQADRTYQGELELQINAAGGLSLINVLPLEQYLLGVLPGEMSPTFPLEALKAQAVAARTFFLYNFGKKHKNAPYDVCDDVHCQVFIGRGNNDKLIQQAVAETRGLVLAHDEKLCLTPYSAVCGGHTEHAQNVWQGKGEPYLTGIFDSPEIKNADKIFSLSSESNVRDWILSKPNVYCNIEWSGRPKFAEYSEKYFRWSRRVDRQEIERLASRRAGTEIGDLFDIRPVKRGVSGRLSEIQLSARNGTFPVRKELNIRRALSEDILYSACFIIEKEAGVDGLPAAFIFKGAGWGHGVGMCQIGAAMMAVQGANFKKILTFYYQNAVLEKLY